MAALAGSATGGMSLGSRVDPARATALQAPVFTPFHGLRSHLGPCRRVSVPSPSTSVKGTCAASTSAFSIRQHHTCRASATASFSVQDADGGTQTRGRQQHWDTLALLVRLRNAVICMGVLAAWACISSGTGSAPALGSVALAASETSATGFQAAAKSAWAGLAAGVLHTLCGPDHLAALTPLTINRNRFAASALGALWGFGHSTGQLILGLAMVLLKERFHDFMPALEKWSGFVVAATLIAIGLMGIYESYFEKEEEASEHVQEEQQGIELALAGAGAKAGATSLKASFATYATGIVYGLQPDALFVVVPALALPTKAAAIAYCCMFVIGTVTAMGTYTLLIGTTSAALTKERPWLQSHLSTIASAIAILVGLLIGLAAMGFDVPFFG